MVDILGKCALLWWISWSKCAILRGMPTRGKCAISEVNVEYKKHSISVQHPKLKTGILRKSITVLWLHVLYNCIIDKA
jgi:hypothetical protein